MSPRYRSVVKRQRWIVRRVHRLISGLELRGMLTEPGTTSPVTPSTSKETTVYPETRKCGRRALQKRASESADHAGTELFRGGGGVACEQARNAAPTMLSV